MFKDNNYIIKIDNDYLVSFEGKGTLSKSSHNGWFQQAIDISEMEFSTLKSDAKVFEGNINLKSGLNKLYDRMRYNNFEFNHLEIIRSK